MWPFPQTGGVPSRNVLMIRALLFEAHIRAAEFWKILYLNHILLFTRESTAVAVGLRGRRKYTEKVSSRVLLCMDALPERPTSSPGWRLELFVYNSSKRRPEWTLHRSQRPSYVHRTELWEGARDVRKFQHRHPSIAQLTKKQETTRTIMIIAKMTMTMTLTITTMTTAVTMTIEIAVKITINKNKYNDSNRSNNNDNNAKYRA